MQRINEKKTYCTPEAVLELLYEISDKWKDENDPIEAMKKDILTMICHLKEDKFKILLDEFEIDHTF
jgi:hypothetical protein